MLKHGRANLFKEDQNMADSDLKLEDICNKLILYGSADEVADKILEFREEVGDFGTLLYAGHDWADVDLAKKSEMSGIQEWLSFYFKSPMALPGLDPEHDIFVQLAKLKNTLRHIMGEDLITHLGQD